MNANLIGQLEGASFFIATSTIDIGPGRTSDRLSYFRNRVRGNLLAALSLIRHRQSAGRTLYTVVETGSGVFFNLTLIGLARVLGYRLVLHHHSSAHIVSERRLFRFLLRIAGAEMWHIVLDQVMNDDLKRRYASAQRTFVLPNAFMIPGVEVVATAMPGGELRVGFLSNLTIEKGLDVVIEMAEQAKASRSKVRFLIGGPLSSRSAHATATRAQISCGSYASFLGPLEGESKQAFFEGIDVFCFPSRYVYEAQPLVVLEAMSYGCALLVSGQGYLRSLVGDAGVLLEPTSMAAQALAVCNRWTTDRIDLERYRHAAFRRFMDLRGQSGKALDAFVAMMSQEQ